MTIRPFTIMLTLGVVANLFVGTAESSTLNDDTPVGLTSFVTSLPSIGSPHSISELVGQWQSDNGQALLLLQSDFTYGYAVESSTLRTSEQGRYQVMDAQLTLIPTDRTAEVNGQQVSIRQDPLAMTIREDVRGNLILDLNGSTYRKA